MPLIYLNPYFLTVLSGSDPYYNNVSLLMHMDSDPFIDEKGHSVTKTSGSTVSLNTSVAKFGGASMYLDGTNSLVTIPSATGDFAFGTGDFTMEAWIAPMAYPASQAAIWTNSPASGTGYAATTLGLTHMANGTLRVQSTYNVFLTGTKTLSHRNWNHVAVTRVGSTMYLFVNGVLDVSATVNNNFSDSTDLKIGGYHLNADGQHFTGYIDDFRITKGVGRYTSTFTIPSEPFSNIGPVAIADYGTDQFYDNVALLLHMDGASNGTSFIDEKGATINRFGSPTTNTSVFKVGTSSGMFSGTGEYLTTPVSTAYGLGKGDFTIEGWFNSRDVTKGNAAIIDFRQNSGGAAQTKPVIDAGQYNINFFIGNAVQASYAITSNTWYNFAWSRTNGTSRFFVNGTLVKSISDTNDYGSTNDICIGEVGDSRAFNGFFNGYLDEIRITKGVARYTTSYTVTTTPFPNKGSASAYDANTTLYDPFYERVSMLMHMDGVNNGTSFPEQKGMAIQKFGSVMTSTATYKYGSASAYFNGSLSFLATPDTPDLGFGTGDFTIETWFNPSTISKATNPIFDFRSTGSTQNRPNLYLNNGNLNFWTAASITATTPVGAANTWYHFAWSRNNGTSRVFLNGGLYATFADTTDYGTSNSLTIGQPNYARSDAAASYNGYIDEFRVTKGIGRYTSSFFAPTVPYADQLVTDASYGSTTFLMHFDGLNGATLLNDQTGNATAVTLSGSVAVNGATTKFGSGSLSVSNEVVTVPYNAGLYLPGEYTIEGWIRPTAYPSSDGQLFRKQGAGSYPAYGYDWFADGRLRAWFGNGVNGTTPNLHSSTSSALPLNQWTHVVQQRRAGPNNTMYSEFFVNGKVVSSVNHTAWQYDGNQSVAFTIASGFQGYIEDLRVTKGKARYDQGEFIPPTQPFPNAGTGTDPFISNVKLLMHGETLTDVKGTSMTASSSGVVSSATVSKFGTKSIYFPGGANLKSAANTLATGANDFTAECWVYPTTGPSSNGSTLMSWKASSGTNSTGAVGFNSSGQLEWGTTAGSLVSSSALMAQNTWQHIAFSRRSNMLYLFYNGTLVASGTDLNQFTSPNGFSLGNRTDNFSTTSFTGYMDEVRLTVGIARYTGPFTPPTAPFPDA